MIESPKTRDTSTDEPSAKDWWDEAWEDWWSSDRLDAFSWAALFLWGALVVVGTNTDFSRDYDWWDSWGVFFVGAGAIVLAEALIRVLVPRYRGKWGWSLFWGSAFLALGLGGLVHSAWYALPLVAISVVILKGALAREG